MKQILLLLALSLALVSWAPSKEEKNVEQTEAAFIWPCDGQAAFVGAGPYLIACPTRCGGVLYVYCHKNKAIALLNYWPGAQCVSFICP